LFLKEPGPDLVAALTRPSLLQGLEDPPEMAEGLRLLAGLDDGGDREAFEGALRWDFTRLFVGPYRLPAPPYESVYTSPERLVMQEAAWQVRQEYARAGLQVRKQDSPPPDHVGLELHFMAFLCRQTLRALQAGEPSAAEGLLRSQKEFFERHLVRWLPRFCEDVLKSAQTDLYRGAALVLRGFLALEEELLQEPSSG
jgi:TorA maturation chaperone TorD